MTGPNAFDTDAQAARGCPDTAWGKEHTLPPDTGPRPHRPGDQAMTIQHGVNRARGRHLHGMRQATQKPLPNLARTPVWLLAFGGNDRCLHRLGKLVGIAEQPARAVTQAL